MGREEVCLKEIASIVHQDNFNFDQTMRWKRVDHKVVEFDLDIVDRLNNLLHDSLLHFWVLGMDNF